MLYIQNLLLIARPLDEKYVLLDIRLFPVVQLPSPVSARNSKAKNSDQAPS